MKKQKKSKKKINKFNSHTTNLTNEQLRKIWILGTIGLILFFFALIIIVVLYFTGKVKILGFPQFANTIPENDLNSGSSDNYNEIQEHIKMYDDYDYDEFYKEQVSKPKKGEEIAEIYLSGTDKTIKVKLFEEEAPKIVKKFKELVNKGYYNNENIYSDSEGVISTNIIDSRIAWAIDPESGETEKISDNLAKSIYSWDSIKVKSNKVLPYNGALCADTLVIDGKLLSADFFIVNKKSNNTTEINELNLPDNLKKLFKKHGGNPVYFSEKAHFETENELQLHGNLLDYLKHPTFGHIFEGMELIDKITGTNKTYKINQIKIVKY